jgi:hypothetical protein
VSPSDHDGGDPHERTSHHFSDGRS